MHNFEKPGQCILHAELREGNSTTNLAQILCTSTASITCASGEFAKSYGLLSSYFFSV